MVKCPYCNAELKLKAQIEPVPIDQKFKDDALTAMNSFIDIQADVMPFGGKMVKSFAKYSLKWVSRYFDEIGAVPVIIQSCQNCDAAISTDMFLNLTSPFGQSSG